MHIKQVVLLQSQALKECHTECRPECRPECHPEYHPECQPECHPDCQDQWNMVRSHTIIV